MENKPRNKEQIEADIAGVQAAIGKNEEMMNKAREELIQQGKNLGYNDEEMSKLLKGETVIEDTKITETEVETPPIITTENVVVENNPKTLKISKREKKNAKDAVIVKEKTPIKKKKSDKPENVTDTTEDGNKENAEVSKSSGTAAEKIPTQVPPEATELETELDKKIEATREKYVEEYKKCKKEADKERLIDKTRNSVFNILAGAKNLFSKHKIEYKKSIKVEDYFTKEMTDAKKEYNQARIEMGETMYNQKKAELEKAGLTGEDLETALTQYKATEILAKTIIDERQKIIDAKAEGAPIKPALWKRLIDGYMSIKPKWKRVALSTIIFLPISAMGAVGAGAIASYGVYGLAGLAGVKFGASMAIGAGVGHLAKGIDWAKKGADLKFKENQDQEKLRLENEFATGKIDVEEYEKEIELIENEEKKRARNRMLLKAGTGGLLALAAGYGSYTAMGLGVEHMGNSVHSGVDAITGPDISHTPTGTAIHTGTPSISDHPRPPLASAGTNPEAGFKIKYPFPIKTPEADNLPPGTHGVLKLHENIVHTNVEATALHGKGAIATLRELQHNLKVEYGNDLDNAPASVKHILNTDAHKLAEEYGMYKPGQDAESAFIKSGSSFKVDANGNVTYHEVGVKTDINLEKGTDIKVNTQYAGKMFDSDHSGIETNPDNTPTTLPDQYKLPPQVNPVTGEPENVIIDKPHTEIPPITKLENLKFKNPLHTISIEKNDIEFKYDANHNLIDIEHSTHGPASVTDYHIRNEVELSKLDGMESFEARVKIDELGLETELLKQIPPNTYEYKFLLEHIIKSQGEIIKEYGNVLNLEKLDSMYPHTGGVIPLEAKTNILSPETATALKQTYIRNIEHLFPDKKIEFWREIKDSYSVEKLMHINKEGGLADVYKPLASHIAKLEEISGLKPVLETAITKAESIPSFIIRAEEAIAKMGKLDEIKL
ncbi:MAG: hypothetical protein WC241_04570 [Candidatus Paceibacterota bacterium]|jgi:hypothetical protein